MVDYNKVKEILEKSEDWDYIKEEIAKESLPVIDETSSNDHDRLGSGILVLDKPLDALCSKAVTSCQTQYLSGSITSELVAYYIYSSCVFYLMLKDFIDVVKDIKITNRLKMVRNYELTPVEYEATNKFIGFLKETDEITYTIKYNYYNDPMYFDFRFIPVRATDLDKIIPFKASNLMTGNNSVGIHLNLRIGDFGYSSFTENIRLDPNKFTKSALESQIRIQAVYYSFEEWYA